MNVIRHHDPGIEVDAFMKDAHTCESVRDDPARSRQQHRLTLDATEQTAALACAHCYDVRARGRVVEIDEPKAFPLQHP